MNYPKFSDMKQAVMNDLDLNEEVFIQTESFTDYYNQGVAFVESQVHTLYEDYFRTLVKRDVTSGDDNLSLPSNIYANKLRKIFWVGQSREDRYEIRRIRDLAQIMFVDENDRYKYDLINEGVTNDVPLAVDLKVYPSFRDTTTYKPIHIYYLRSANRFEDDDSVCDIPEFSEVVNQYVRYRCRKKEGHPLTDLERDDLNLMIANMIETLKSRVPDENDELLKDLSFYSDFDPYFMNI